MPLINADTNQKSQGSVSAFPSVRQCAARLQSQGRALDAMACWYDAMKDDPLNPEYAWEYGSALIQTGQVSEGLGYLKKIVDQVPDNPKLGSCYLRMLHYHTEDCHTVFRAYQVWAEQYTQSLKAYTHHNKPEPDRVLRIGYISPDFYRHSVAYFFESLLIGHDRNSFEIAGYGQVETPDDMTDRLVRQFDLYRDVQGQSDDQVARLIHEDQIDILVDLAGHTQGNRLLVLARKPAPVQLTYLGHPAGTGLPQIDYRITDMQADVPEAQSWHSEQLMRLPDGFLCYTPPEYAPPVAPLPCLRKGYVTFGSFNNNCKLTDQNMALWARILKAVPESRLILKFKWAGDAQIRDLYYERFRILGIESGRIDIHGHKDPVSHLALYHDIDIGLDTFPYHGTTTTCEAFWMGVPVVTRVGQGHESRVGLSLLTRVGLAFFAANTELEYMQKACALASQPEALALIRQSMRTRMQSGTLCQPVLFTRQMEYACRQAWRTWCEKQTRGHTAMGTVQV